MSEHDLVCGCEEFNQLNRGLSRRGFLTGVLSLGGGLVISVEPGFDYTVAQAAEQKPDTIVMVSMRGGMDGLMAVPVLGDSNLRNYRPKTALVDSQNISLDNHFGLHRDLSGFKTLFDSKELAVVHAVGTPKGTRSHFDDQLAVELAAYEKPGTTAGWQTRYLQATGATEVLSGYSGSQTKPAAFRGANQAVTFEDIASVTITSIGNDRGAHLRLLQNMHKNSDHVWSKSALNSISASESLKNVAETSLVEYPDTKFGRRLKLLAAMLKAGTAVKTANIDFAGDLDVHSNAGILDGVMADNFKNLNDSVLAFKLDVGSLWNSITIVTVTEFGRRLSENGSAGLDHGWGSAMFVMGGGVNGGKVVADWPGISEADLSNGDLKVTTDYRHVIADVLRYRGNLSSSELAAIFPDFQPKTLGLAKQLG